MDKELSDFIEKTVKSAVDTAVEKRVQEILKESRDSQNRAAIIASKGTLDMAYPPLILASTAAALNIQTSIYFTFYGLNIIHKKKNAYLQVAPVGNPAMPIPIPNLIGMLPGMTPMATLMMRKWMGAENVPTIPELLDLCIDGGVKLIGCQMSMNVMGIKREDLIDQIEVGGAAAFLDYASQCNITLFI